MKARILCFTAILFFLVSCEPAELDSDYQKAGDESKPTAVPGYKLTIQAIKKMDTKALELEGNTLKAYWVDGEKVGVYVNGTYEGQLTATREADSTKATLYGTLTNTSGIATGATIMLLYPDRTDINIDEGTRWNYTGQNGAAPAPAGDLSTKYDYATATLSISDVDNDNHEVTTTGPAAFQNEQSVYRFGFLVAGEGQPIAVKDFTIASPKSMLVRTRSWSGTQWSSAHGSLTVTSPSAPAGNLYYMSLRNEYTGTGDEYAFTLVGSNDMLYLGSKAIAGSLSAGQFYTAPDITVNPVRFAPDNSQVISREQEVL